MPKVTIHIDNEKTLTALENYLNSAGLSYYIDQDEDDEALEAALRKALAQADKGIGRPHAEVMKAIRARYGLKH